MTTSIPLNGSTTHPLTAHALAELRSLLRGPRPSQEFNPGVRDRFDRERLTETVMLPSPFKTHKGSNVAHLQLTDAGRARLEQGA